MKVVVAVVLVVCVCFTARVTASHTRGANPFEGCRQPVTEDEKPTEAFWNLLYATLPDGFAVSQRVDDDDDDDSPVHVSADDVPFYCIDDPDTMDRIEHPPTRAEDQKPRGLDGRGPSNMKITAITPVIPCGKNVNVPHRGLDTAGASSLWCPTNGRKTRIILEGEVRRIRGGGAELAFQIPLVGDIDNPTLTGDEIDAALNEKKCLRDTFCRVPLHDPATITVKVSEARTYWPIEPTLNHIAYAGRLDDAIHVPTDQFVPGAYGPVPGPVLSQASPDRLAALAGTDDSDAFVFSSSAYGDCNNRMRGNASRAMYHENTSADAEANLSAEGTCDFQWADGLLNQATKGTLLAQGACLAALCVGPGNDTAYAVRYSEFGNHCTLYDFAGEAEPLFTIEITATPPSDGGRRPPATTDLFPGGASFAVPLKDSATAYTVHRGRGAGNTFWEEGARKGTRKATVRARALFGPPPQPEGAPVRKVRNRNAEDHRFGPSRRSLGGHPLICGRLHDFVINGTAWPTPFRLPSAQEYWTNLELKSVELGTDLPRYPPGLGSNSSALLAAGGELRVPTAFGHRGADAAWAWVPSGEGIRDYGRRVGEIGQSRTNMFYESYAQLEDICAAGLNRTHANMFYMPQGDQPCTLMANNNRYAYHPATAAYVRGNAPPGRTRAEYGALERPTSLPPVSVFDEGSHAPGFYPVRCMGSPGGPQFGGGQRLPLGFVHESTRLGDGAEETASHRHAVTLQVEVDDSWFHIDPSDHYTARATGTVYALRLLDNSAASGLSSHCIRHGSSDAPTDPFSGDGYIRLAYVTAGDTPVRSETKGDWRPLRKRYRAEIECDPSVGRLVPLGSRVDIGPTQTTASVRFMAAVGGPAGTVTALDHLIRLEPPPGDALSEYLMTHRRMSPWMRDTELKRSENSRLREHTGTGVCRVSLYSDEPESSDIMVGNAAVLPCSWTQGGTHFNAGSGPARHKPAPPDCHFMTSDPRCSTPFWIDIGITAGVMALLVLFTAAVVLVSYMISEKVRRSQIEKQLAANDSKPTSLGNDTGPVDELADYDDDIVSGATSRQRTARAGVFS